MPDPKRRGPASRPAKPGEAKRVRPARPGAASSAARQRAGDETNAAETASASPSEPIRQSIVESVEHQSEQRLGSTARRAAILAVVVCVLTLTIAGPVRTYFSQRTEQQQLASAESQLRSQISSLEQQKSKLADPAYIAAQARERLGFVMPGDTPYQVQLPAGALAPVAPPVPPATAHSNQPWYTALWHTIADEPHGVSPAIAPPGDPAAPGEPLPPAPPAPEGPPGG